MPHQPTPSPEDQPDTSAPAARRARAPQPVPLALWFVPTTPTDHHDPTGPWLLPPLLAEKIVNDYANPGSTVAAAGASAPEVHRAAAELDCHTPTHRSHAGVNLLVLTPGQPLPAASGGWTRWTRRLRPGGLLAVVLAPDRAPHDPTAVVAAAVAASLAYLQHIPAVLSAPDDPLDPPQVVGGHLWQPQPDTPITDLLPAHADVLLFTAPAGPDIPGRPDGTGSTEGGAR